MNKLPSKNYKDYEIIPRTDGFYRYSLSKSGSIGNFDLGFLATYIVRKDYVTTMFGFAVGGLDMFAEPNHPKFNQKTLQEQAVNVIKQCIDSGKINENKEFTFEYYSPNFFPVTKPEWWTKQITVR